MSKNKTDEIKSRLEQGPEDIRGVMLYLLSPWIHLAAEGSPINLKNAAVLMATLITISAAIFGATKMGEGQDGLDNILNALLQGQEVSEGTVMQAMAVYANQLKIGDQNRIDLSINAPQGVTIVSVIFEGKKPQLITYPPGTKLTWQELLIHMGAVDSGIERIVITKINNFNLPASEFRLKIPESLTPGVNFSEEYPITAEEVTYIEFNPGGEIALTYIISYGDIQGNTVYVRNLQRLIPQGSEKVVYTKMPPSSSCFLSSYETLSSTDQQKLINNSILLAAELQTEKYSEVAPSTWTNAFIVTHEH